jgi:hypothetical protein
MSSSSSSLQRSYPPLDLPVICSRSRSDLTGVATGYYSGIRALSILGVGAASGAVAAAAFTAATATHLSGRHARRGTSHQAAVDSLPSLPCTRIERGPLFPGAGDGRCGACCRASARRCSCEGGILLFSFRALEVV